MKENITKFDMESAFKALDEIAIPKVKGIRANREDLKESTKRVDRLSMLVEDYYDVGNKTELEAAQEVREDEVAKAKLARIEKIVDLDADSAEELLPSYVGKIIVQCPQCMTLFYKDAADVENSETDETVCNVGEICQHCGNDSGYTVIGKVDSVEEPINDEPVAEGEPAVDDIALDLPAEEPVEEVPSADEEAALADASEEAIEEPVAEEEVPVEEAEEDEEEKNESLNLNKEFHDINKKNASDYDSENLTLNEGSECANGECEEKPEEAKEEEVEESVNLNKEFHDINKKNASENDSENLTLNESKEDELDSKLADYNEYVKYVQDKIDAANKELEACKNDLVKENIKKQIENLRAELEEALPKELKTAVETNELPSPEELEDKKEDAEVEESVNLNKEFHDINKKHASENDSENLTINEGLLDGNSVLSGNSVNIDLGNAGSAIAGALLADEAGEKEVDHEAEELNEDTLPAVSDANVDKLFDSKEFQTPVSDAEIKAIFAADESANESFDVADIEDFDEEEFNECASNYLKEVYENANSFETTDCRINGKTLVVEGTIKFNSGKTKTVNFEFNSGKLTESEVTFTGKNNALCEGNGFTLTCALNENCLKAKSLAYSYKVGNDLVEGLSIRK